MASFYERNTGDTSSIAWGFALLVACLALIVTRTGTTAVMAACFFEHRATHVPPLGLCFTLKKMGIYSSILQFVCVSFSTSLNCGRNRFPPCRESLPLVAIFFREKKTLSVLARTPPTKTVVQEYSPASCVAIIHPALGLELPVD